MNILGLIPARGGSKEIPRKTSRSLAGSHCPSGAWRPRARAYPHKGRWFDGRRRDRRAATAEVLVRPSELAADDTSMFDVIRHAIDELVLDIVVLLQPNVPASASQRTRRPGRRASARKRRRLRRQCDRSPHRYRPDALDESTARVSSRREPPDRAVRSRRRCPNGLAVFAVHAARLAEISTRATVAPT